MKLVCRKCGSGEFVGSYFRGCPECSGALFAHVDARDVHRYFSAISGDSLPGTANLLPPGCFDEVSLGEGDTPMFLAADLGALVGTGSLWIKDETANPTGSYKDRMNAAAVSAAKAFDGSKLTSSSTGNQAVSLAAYCAAADMRVDVLLPDVAPAMASTEVCRFGGHAWVAPWELRGAIVQRLVESHGYGYVGRNCPRPLANPYGIEGYKGIAYEIVRDMKGAVPGVVVMPSCGGDGIYGTWRGFCELKAAGITEELPFMVGVHLAASPSVTRAWESGLDCVLSAPILPTAALSLVDERGGDHALWALYESQGRAISVRGRGIAKGLRLASEMGIEADPAGAVGLGALEKLLAVEPEYRHKSIVVVVTGGGARWSGARDQLARVNDNTGPLEAILASE